MRLKDLTFFLLLAVLFTASCIREDLDGCLNQSRNELFFSYLGDGDTEIFSDKIHRVEVYVFDAEGHLVTSFSVPADQLAQRTAVLPPLSPGDYRIICIGNADDTGITGLESGNYDDILFAADRYIAGQDVDTNDPLYYATIDYTITEEDQSKTVFFASSHFKVSVEVSGIPDPSTTGAELPLIQISGVLPTTNFENEAGGDPTVYTFPTNYDAGLLTALANIMRQSDFSDVYVRVVTPSGTVLAEVNLAQFLADNPSIDITLQEVLIPIHIAFKQMGVEVSLPEWFIKDVKPEF